jgi:Tfp pilus assembly protein PilZ
MAYTGPDRRKFPRIKGSFVVSYRPYKQEDSQDISQTKNFSLGGILLTTNKAFEIGTLLTMQIKIPVSREALHFVGKVLASKEVVKGLIYETRIAFLEKDQVPNP